MSDSYPEDFAKWYKVITNHRDFESDITRLCKLDLPSVPRILDFGCGDCRHAEILSQKINTAKLTAYDPSSGFSKLNNNLQDNGIKFCENLADISGKFDLIMSWCQPLNFVIPAQFESTVNKLIDLSAKNSQWLFEIWNPQALNYIQFKRVTRVYSLQQSKYSFNHIIRDCLPKKASNIYDPQQISGVVDFEYRLYSEARSTSNLISETTHRVYFYTASYFQTLLGSRCTIGYSSDIIDKLRTNPASIQKSTIFLHTIFN